MINFTLLQKQRISKPMNKHYFIIQIFIKIGNVNSALAVFYSVYVISMCIVITKQELKTRLNKSKALALRLFQYDTFNCLL